VRGYIRTRRGPTGTTYQLVLVVVTETLHAIAEGLEGDDGRSDADS
jgi:hypothetical protein